LSSSQNPLATLRQTPRDPDLGRDLRLGTTGLKAVLLVAWQLHRISDDKTRAQHLVNADASKPVSTGEWFLHQARGEVSTIDITSRQLLMLRCYSLDLWLFNDDF
jgi:hypothetical protein